MPQTGRPLREIITRALFAIVMVISLALLGRMVGIASPWYCLVASFSVLGLLDLAMHFVHLRLPRSLRTIRAWELLGRVYERLGVRLFGTLLRRSPLRLLNRRVYFEPPRTI